jgi:hypothetical protein
VPVSLKYSWALALTITATTLVAWKRKTTARRKGPLLRTVPKSPSHSNAYPRLKNTSDRISLKVLASPTFSGREATLLAFKARL